jgi:hypothetical protein
MSENNRPESARQVTVRVVWDADSDSSTWIATAAARTGSRPEVEVITTTPCGRVYVARSVRRREFARLPKHSRSARNCLPRR